MRALTMGFLALFASIAFFSAPTLAKAQACGGLPAIVCSKDTWCELKPGACKIPDASGECVKVPHACNKMIKPVCGCDGKTYNNDCERQQAKVSLDHDGACGSEK